MRKMLTKVEKAKWVEALASGDYPKGTTYLKNNGRFCCLGVLADVLDGVEIKSNGVSILCDEGELDYFKGDLGVDNDTTKKLVDYNDGVYPNDKDFKNMIPIIEEIVPTID